MRISDWSSDVCSSDLEPSAGEARLRARRPRPAPEAVQPDRQGAEERRPPLRPLGPALRPFPRRRPAVLLRLLPQRRGDPGAGAGGQEAARSEEHTSELQSLMRISYAVFCLKKKKKTKPTSPVRICHIQRS